MGKHLNLVGERFGRLVVNNKAGKDFAHRFLWDCVCDCGKLVTIPTQRLRNGQTKSCGCARRLVNRNSVIEKKLFVRFKATAKKNNHKVTLSLDEFKNQIRQNCFYCGIEPSNVYIYEWTNEKYKYS